MADVTRAVPWASGIMRANPVSEAETATSPASRGWWYVLALLLPAMFLHGAFDPPPLRDGWSVGIDLPVLLTADILITLRAVVGLAFRQDARWWPVYASLLFLTQLVRFLVWELL